MDILRAYILSNHMPAGSALKFGLAAKEILNHTLNAAGNVANESYYGSDPNDPTRLQQVVLIAANAYGLNEFFGDVFDKQACFKKAFEFVQTHAAADNLLQPVTPDEYLKNMPGFAVIALT